ncbi:nitroreductase family protein [Chloroflexota bacterium]
MNISEAIHQRKSIRAFQPEPVSQEILKGIIELALRAPSWANTQPWEFAIVGGRKLEEIRRAFIAHKEEQPNPDLAPPREYPEPYDTRRRVLGRKLFEIQGISRDDEEKRKWWQLQGLMLFGAPSVIYIYIDRSFYFQGDSLNVWPIFDCGLIAQNIMLLATKYKLGTIPQIRAAIYPDVLRKILGIADSKIIVLGIAIGYPDWDDGINKFRSEREPFGSVTKWYGFD